MENVQMQTLAWPASQVEEHEESQRKSRKKLKKRKIKIR
jgi:hypothetical protein